MTAVLIALALALLPFALIGLALAAEAVESLDAGEAIRTAMRVSCAYDLLRVQMRHMARQMGTALVPAFRNLDVAAADAATVIGALARHPALAGLADTIREEGEWTPTNS